MNPESDTSKIEELKKKLYANNLESSVIDGSDKKIMFNQSAASRKADLNQWDASSRQNSFQENPPEPEHPSAGHFFKMLFIGSIVFCFIAACVAAVMFLGNYNRISTDNIDIEATPPVSIDGGQQLSIPVTVTNKNRVDLTNATVEIEYPTGAYSATDTSIAISRDQYNIGSLKAGSEAEATFNSVLFGQENATDTVTIIVQYNIAGSDTLYTKEKDYSILLAKAPISLLVDYDAAVNSGEDVTLSLTAVSNSSAPLSNILLKAVYPSGFTFTGADNDPATGTEDTWQLGNFVPGQKKTLAITGTIQGNNNDQEVFKFALGSQEPDDVHTIATTFVSTLATMSIDQAFLTGNLSLGQENSSGDIVTSPGSYLNGSLSVQNNLTTPVTNLNVQVIFQGQLLDQYSVKSTNGYYASGSSTLSWNKVSDGDLASMDAGQSTSLQFSFATLPLEKLSQLVRNPQMPVQVVISGDTVTPDGVRPITVKFTKNIEFSTTPTLDASVSYSKGPFKNTGPVPPRANQSTTYTILLNLKNTSNQVSNTVLTALLPVYMNFVPPPSGGPENIAYDSDTHTLTWNIGELTAYTGYSTAVRTAAFQVVIDPSVSQIGDRPSLITNIQMTGVDRFTGNMIQLTSPDLTTDLLNTEDLSGVVSQ